MDSLLDEVILAIHIGYAPTITDPKPDLGYNAPREILFNTLESLQDVDAMFVYEDSHVGFLVPKSFLIVCKSANCRSRFYASPEETNFQISRRIVPSVGQDSTLQYYDGVTQIYYQVAPKAWETIYCRREPMPFECNYRHLDFSKPIFEFKLATDDKEAAFDVTTSADDGEDTPMTRVFANVDIPKGSYIMADHSASSLQLSHTVLKQLEQDATNNQEFVNFVQTHGHDSLAKGSQRRLVEIGASYFIRSSPSQEECNVGRWIPPHPLGKRPKYSPVYERHRLSFDVFMVATKDIPKGQELIKYKHMWTQE